MSRELEVQQLRLQLVEIQAKLAALETHQAKAAPAKAEVDFNARWSQQTPLHLDQLQEHPHFLKVHSDEVAQSSSGSSRLGPYRTAKVVRLDELLNQATEEMTHLIAQLKQLQVENSPVLDKQAERL